MDSKYWRLYDWFSRQTAEKIVLTFEEIEEILGFKLCDTAYKDRPYWCNHETCTLAKTWVPHHYYSYDVDVEKHIAYFVKDINRVKGTKRIFKSRSDIEKPSDSVVQYWVDEWDKLDKYVAQEKSLNKLFLELMKDNNTLENTLAKCSVLNDFYSTNLFNTYLMAKHILSLNFDKRLKEKDETLVDDIAKCPLIKSYEYSFASKYCSHHDQENYPIYDSYVDKMLRYFRNVDHFDEFDDSDLKVYSRFKKILKNFIAFYNLTCNLKDLDRYLWQAGKKYFPKKYY